MTTDELFFFNTKPDALPLYAVLAEKMLAAFPNVTVEVKQTQKTLPTHLSAVTAGDCIKLLIGK